MTTEHAELYRKHRPTDFDQVLGQNEAINSLKQMARNGGIPHALLFLGESGCGKTTLARILRTKLRCGDHDFHEINASENRGIDAIRSIKDRMGLSPMSGKSRVYLLDESHALTADAQNAFLKLLEDTPQHVYFMLATTDPQKLKKTIQTRCTPIKVRPLKPAEMMELLKRVCQAEKKKIPKAVAEQIVEVSEGGSRKALVLLNQVIDLEDEEDQLKLIRSADVKRQGFEIARALANPKTPWKSVAELITNVEEEPETVRRIILGYAQSMLLKSGNPRGYAILNAFRDHWYDCGRPGLTAACWEVVNG